MNTCGFNFDTTYTALPELFFTKITPDPVASPAVVILNDDLACSMGLDFSKLSSQEQAALFSGNQTLEGSSPFAQAYAGHQFGHFTMLGDGRAHLWGEHVTPHKERFDIQFKGSGRTPYSRSGDGRAVLAPMLREYIISQAMYYLGVPTTRSLAVVMTGELVRRETDLPGAILTRVASSHIRVGTFQYAAIQQDKDVLSALMNYTIKRHYPHLINHENKALALVELVMQKQIELIVHWMRVGFIHGVMNTDNMVLSGETIDYGPCAFMDIYDPYTVFSSIDHGGRYAFANQANIAQWNLTRLAEALLPLINTDTDQAITMAEKTLQPFSSLFQEAWFAMMRNKLGLFGKEKEDEVLIDDLLKCMQNHSMDYTNTFRALISKEKPSDKLYSSQEFQDWWSQWQNRLQQNNKPLQDSFDVMRENNPSFVPRNHKVEEGLAAAQEKSDFSKLHALLNVLADPYRSDLNNAEYQKPPNPDERVYQTFCGT